MRYIVRPIDEIVLKQLRTSDDAGHAPRVQEDSEGGAPLRCCLRPSLPGERPALVSYAPLHRWAAATGADPGPYDELGPVFIHPGPCPGYEGPGYPQALHRGPRVFRAYSADGHILGGRVVEPGDHEAAAAELFADERTALIHVRAVEYGCFLFALER